VAARAYLYVLICKYTMSYIHASSQNGMPHWVIGGVAVG
jgi:hypothetical protein